MIKCKICLKNKDKSCFYKHPKTKSWFESRCKECAKSVSRSNRSKEKDRNHYYNSPKRRLKSIFWKIKDRCNNTNDPRYKNYWWRWIRCLRKSLDEFRSDMMDSYVEHREQNKSSRGKRHTTIERIDVNWNYCKDNCIWVWYADQARNKSNTIRYEWLTISERSNKLWVNYKTFYSKYVRLNKDFERTVEYYKK